MTKKLLKFIAWDQYVSEYFYSETYQEALKEAKEWYCDADWGQSEKTCWIEFLFGLSNEAGDEPEDYDTITVALEPDCPECVDSDEHDFQSPYKIVGGIKENPGVFGNGGGVIITEVCVKCVFKKTTDTWAQNPNNGEQGLTSIAYQPNFYPIESNNTDD